MQASSSASQQRGVLVAIARLSSYISRRRNGSPAAKVRPTLSIPDLWSSRTKTNQNGLKKSRSKASLTLQLAKPDLDHRCGLDLDEVDTLCEAIYTVSDSSWIGLIIYGLEKVVQQQADKRIVLALVKRMLKAFRERSMLHEKDLLCQEIGSAAPEEGDPALPLDSHRQVIHRTKLKQAVDAQTSERAITESQHHGVVVCNSAHKPDKTASLDTGLDDDDASMICRFNAQRAAGSKHNADNMAIASSAKCPFLTDAPVEIRLAIYEDILQFKKPIHRCKYSPQDVTSILRVNKQVHHEALPVLYKVCCAPKDAYSVCG